MIIFIINLQSMVQPYQIIYSSFFTFIPTYTFLSYGWLNSEELFYCSVFLPHVNATPQKADVHNREQKNLSMKFRL